MLICEIIFGADRVAYKETIDVSNFPTLLSFVEIYIKKKKNTKDGNLRM